jgi:hypothetical protein
MVLQTNAGSHLFTLIPTDTSARLELLALTITHVPSRAMQRVAHAARDRVPLGSCLQIPVNALSRLIGTSC